MDQSLKPTNEQQDSLHILPLCMIPIQTPALRRACLVKNSRLETAVELFRDKAGVSGQLYVRDLPDFFVDTDEKTLMDDMVKIRGLDTMPSFDVYSCRISLRALGIAVNDEEYLKLSIDRQATLADRMRDFTRPLIAQVFGQDVDGMDDSVDLIDMLRNPHQEDTRQNLIKLARELDVKVLDIPRFVEDYGDIFLSLAYFRDCLDKIAPVVERFSAWLEEMKGAWTIRNDRSKERMIESVEADMKEIVRLINLRFETFDRKTADFWNNASAEHFKAVRKYIISHHTSVGGVLCGLTMKMDSWETKFPSRNPGGPQARMEFLIGEILPGLETIKKLERSAIDLK
ncbi:MAG: hypothetical protein P1V34_04210 [Alphaproteobacteria bacterium]|nr:hypothetical protein [Alphaproteobacteria bacterium]